MRDTRRKATDKLQAQKREWLQQYKERAGCCDCGANLPHYVLEFDHREGRTIGISIAAFSCCSGWDKLRYEVSKCDVVCANCHKIRSWTRGQFHAADKRQQSRKKAERQTMGGS